MAAIPGLDNYQRALRGNFRAFWSETFVPGSPEANFDIFVSVMQTTVRIGMRNAWNAGAASCGIKENELTQAERLERQSAIINEIDYAAKMALTIKEQTKRNKYLLRPLLSRAEVWAKTYRNVYNRGMAMACGDKKKEWFLGATEKHCPDCSVYHGRVYRLSIWLKYGIQPQGRKLNCHGFYCDCDWKDTDKPITPGRPPSPTG